MDLVKLKYFYVVAQLQHVTKAAEILHVSQPSLTQAIHSLEQDLGVTLFNKQGRSIVINEYGIYLQNRLKDILPELDNIPQELQTLKNKVNKSVKLNILAASSLIVDLIIKFRKQYPDVVFDFEQNSLKNDCDIVIATNGVNTDKLGNLTDKTIIEEKIYLAVPKDSTYANCSSVNLIDVKDENFIMLSNSRLFGVICNNLCSQAGFTPKIIFESDSPFAVQDIISIGTGIAFWPEFAWGKIKNKNINLIPISYPICKRDIIIQLHNVNNKVKTGLYVNKFYNFIVEELKKYK